MQPSSTSPIVSQSNNVLYSQIPSYLSLASSTTYSSPQAFISSSNPGISAQQIIPSFFKQDIIIIGGGIIGSFIAYQILRESPKTKVLVLERGIIPTGASLKNLGIICCADIPGLLDDMKAYGEEYVVEDAKERYEGIQEYKTLFDQETIGLVEDGFYEFFYEHELGFLDQVDSINKLLWPVFKENVFEIRNEKIKEFGMNTDIFKGAVYNKFEACLDSGKLIRTLISKISSLGGLYLTGSKVLSHQKINSEIIEILVQNPLSKSPLKFKCNKVVYAINGFAKTQFPEIPLTSGKGQIICSKPIENIQQFTGTYANDFYYFRVMNNRLMLGGGSRIDFKKLDVFELKNSDSVIKHIKREIGKCFPGIEFNEVEFEWNGLMAFSNDPEKMYQGPMIKILEDNVILVCRLCGNGVSIAPQLSKKISTILEAKVIKKDEAKL